MRPFHCCWLIKYSQQALRAATLWCMGKVTYDKDGKPIAAKTFNPATGKDSSKDAEFSIGHYGVKTTQFVAAARKLSAESVNQIVQAALDKSEVSIAAVPAAAADPLRVALEFDYSELTED